MQPEIVKFSGPLDLDRTFSSGQCFRWVKKGDAYEGVVEHRAFSLLLKEGRLFVTSDTPGAGEFIRSYLDLDTDYDRIEHELSAAGGILKDACQYGSGLRLLRQHPWETLISFIISANNNIRRITGVIDRMCRWLGTPTMWPDMYGFPVPERLSACSEAELRALGLGYRAPYVREAALMVASGAIDLEHLHTLPEEEMRKQLLKVPGVGRKVADCVMLFAYRQTSVCPVDVWMKRALLAFYVEAPCAKVEDMRRLFLRRHGCLSGFAQNYLFYYLRNCPSLVGPDSPAPHKP
ncbi:MAG: DNA glycosylase [Bacillota bacterium]